jgi:hypothetical protein
MTPPDNLLTATMRLPQHVVYRTFVKETVILNLQTGKYHGLNPTGGRMLQMLEKSETAREAATKLADEYGRPVAEIEEDVAAFCADLLDRGLIEMSGGEA